MGRLRSILPLLDSGGGHHTSDPLFIDKVRDIVGLYMFPPDHAVVLCVDEKTQVQALDRTQPIFPMLPGVPERQSHDYKRNGMIDLYAALNLATGEVTHQLTPQHRAIEFKKFLQLIDKSVPKELDVHIVIDNHSTHKTPAIKKWLLAHPRFHIHFTPTSSSWLNLVWVGSPRSPRSGSGEEPIAASRNSPTPSRTGSGPGTMIPVPMSGTRPLTRSSNPSADI